MGCISIYDGLKARGPAKDHTFGGLVLNNQSMLERNDRKERRMGIPQPDISVLDHLIEKQVVVLFVLECSFA